MKSLLLITLLWGADTSIDFDTQVAPVLSKSGCNAASCHGAAAGRGGFKLSLFGGDANVDYDAIVRQLEGRRINLSSPADSLLLAKPTGYLEHEGGVRLDSEGSHAQLITRWIEQGARRVRRHRLIDVRVEPSQVYVERLPEKIPLRVTAVFRDRAGQEIQRDVSDVAVFESTDAAALKIGSGGSAVIKRRGRHVAVVRFMSKVLTVRFTAPLTPNKVDLSSAPRHNWIDDLVLKNLDQLRIPQSSQAADATLLRRTTIDLTGRLPTIEEARAYLAADAPDKHVKLVDRLLKSDRFADYWTFKLAKLLRLRGQPGDSNGVAAFHGWLRERLLADASFARMARTMVTAEGDSHEVGPANFYRIARGPRAQAEYLSETLMGVRLRCANCHNHPLDRWTQEDYHGLAALFANIDQSRIVRTLKGGEVINPKTGSAAPPRIPGVRDLADGEAGRAALARWLTSDDNPYFARATANRIWKAMMGRGLIEPVDDLRETNPATHPELLKQLARSFAGNDYQVRLLVRTIALSAAYQRGRASGKNRFDDRYYSHALQRPLEPEVLADAISDVTGVAERFGGQPAGTRAVNLIDPRTPSTSLDVLGRCPREDSCESSADGAGGLSTRLHLINGPLLNAKITDAKGTLHKRIKNGDRVETVVESFYLAALSRKPTAKELRFWKREIGEGPARDHRPALEDFVWSLLSSREFVAH